LKQEKKKKNIKLNNQTYLWSEKTPELPYNQPDILPGVRWRNSKKKEMKRIVSPWVDAVAAKNKWHFTTTNNQTNLFGLERGWYH